MFANTSTRPGIDISFVMIALRNARRDAIQSRLTAHFKRLTTNSVMGNGSRLPNKDTEIRWRQRFNSRKSNVGTPRASQGTHFPDSLQKLLPAHADDHAKTQQMYRDQQHQEFSPRLSPPEWYWRGIGLTPPHKHVKTWTFLMFAPAPISLSRAPQIQCCSVYAPSPNQARETECVVKYLHPRSGSKNCALSSAQIERHSVTN